ncbi:hypothetical protein B0T25DRAFT_357259 [Lasiosphaeria hispida]|uniref:Uncharacterized protein n=1 Tax=Lasiosphaeria hispida TaxID=260671 RepID=A0AAJ0H7E1_9PEZI|nr:hypothetical protein B0T25DRAFT_357259 [Lasiosphaeria hispida]
MEPIENEDGDRPIILYTGNAKFRPADRVWVRVSDTATREGPYTVAAVEGGRYKLCNKDRTPVKGGSWLEEEALEIYDTFE